VHLAAAAVCFRAGELSAEELEQLMTIVANPQQYKIPNWFLNRCENMKRIWPRIDANRLTAGAAGSRQVPAYSRGQDGIVVAVAAAHNSSSSKGAVIVVVVAVTPLQLLKLPLPPDMGCHEADTSLGAAGK
jgi:hypothetical protein